VTQLPDRRRTRAVLALLVVTIIWGWTFVWMKQGLDAAQRVVGTSTHASVVGMMVALRFGTAALLLPVFQPACLRELDKRGWLGGLLLGGLLVSGFELQILGLTGVSAPVSAFLTSLYVIFTAMIGAVVLRRIPAGPMLVGVLLATFGAGFISGPPQLSFDLPEWLTVGGAFIFSLHILATDRVTKVVSPSAVTFATFVVIALGGLATFGYGMSRADAPDSALLRALATDPGYLRPMLLTIVLATVVALSLMNRFQRDLPPVRAAILYALEPVWATLVAVSMGMETFGTWLLIGGGALIAGNLIAELGPRRAAAALLPPAPPPG